MLAAIACCVSANVARAQVDTWTSTSSGAWGTGVNWSAGVPSSANTATFNGSAGLMNGITLLPSSMAGSLSFVSTGGANAYTFDTAATANNNTLTITSGITNSDTAEVTFYNTTTLAGAQTWTNNGGALAFSGNVNLGSGTSAYALTVNGADAVTIAGVIANGAASPASGSLTYSGTGLLTLTGTNTYSGGTTINSGTVNIQNNSALGGGAVSVAPGRSATATLQLQGGLTGVANAITLNGDGSTNVMGSSQGALDNLSGNNTVTGAITLGSAAQINSDSGTLSITTGGITGTNQNLTVGGSGNTSISGVIATGSGTLTKTGSGTLTLSGANTFTGATSINGGSLSISADNNLGTAPGGVVTGDLIFGGGTLDATSSFTLNANRGILLDAAGGTIDTASGSTLTYGGGIAGSGGLTVTDSGTLLLTGGGSYTGATTINSGANLQLGNGTANANLTGTSGIADNGSLILDENSAVTLSKAISGTGTVTQNGSANTTLSGTNTYSGATTVNSGTLTAGSAAAFGGTGESAVTVNNSGVLALNGFSNTVGSIASGSATSSITLGSGTLTTGGNNASTTFAGVISGTGGLTLTGNSVLVLDNANTYSGLTTINSGANLQLGAATNGTIASTSGIVDNGALNFTEASAVTIGASISGTGTVGLHNAGNVTLSGTNTYSGATLIYNSVDLIAGSTSAFGGATGLSAVTINQSGVLSLNGFSNTVGSIASASATSSIALGSGTLTTGGNNASTTFAGIISSTGPVSGSSLVVAGTGTLTLTNANTYTGTTTINSGASLELGNGTTNGTVASVGITDNGSLILDENTGVTVGAPISGTGGVTASGAVQDTLSGTNTYSGATVINGTSGLLAGSTSAFGGTGESAVTINNSGVLSLNGFNNTVGSIASASATTGIALGSSTLTTGGNNSSTTFAGDISGTGGILTKVGTGTMTLTGANSYTGATNINGGALSIGQDSELGTAPGSATANMLTFNGGTLDTTKSFALGSNRGITLNAGGGTFVPTAKTTVTYGGIIAGTGALTLAGPGNMSLTGANTYTGATNLNGGTLTIGADGALGAAPATATANMLNFNSGVLATTASFTLNANRGMSVNAAGGGGTINVASGTALTYGGLIAGTGSLAVTGGGTLNLTSNALNFSGSSTVTSSELELSGTLPSLGTLTLGAGSTLLLNGSDLSVSSLVITGNAIIDFGSSASTLNLTNFSIGMGDTLTVMDWTNQIDYLYTQNWTGATLGTTGTGAETQVTFTGNPSSSTGWLSYDKEISPAPEPATYGAIFVGISLAGIVLCRRKRLAA